MLKYVSLVILCSQNALLILVMRYVRTRAGDMFISTTAVIMSELLKVFTCLIIIGVQVWPSSTFPSSTTHLKFVE